MSYIKQNFTSGQTLKAEHLNHMEDGIEAIANNVQIKKVVFTDRQSIYQWLLENDNYSKVIYINVFCTQYPWNVKYMPHFQNNGENSAGSFGLVQINTFPDGTLVPSTILMSDSQITMSIDEAININEDNTLTGRYSEPMTIPDEYWSVMEIECTVYYFAE